MIALEMTGKTIEDAIEKGLKQWNLTKNDVSIEVVDKGRKGILFVKGRDAKVRFVIKSIGKTVEAFTICFMECMDFDGEFDVIEGKRSYTIDYKNTGLLDKYGNKVFISIEHIINKSLADILEGVPVYVTVNGQNITHKIRRPSIKKSQGTGLNMRKSGHNDNGRHK